MLLYQKIMLVNNRYLLRRVFVLVIAVLLPLWTSAEPLSSWAEGKTKQSIIDFVTATTSKSSKSFVAPPQRIAVFDNDGTLWAEQPIYFQAMFAFDQIKNMAEKHPEWKTEEPYASVIKGDIKNALHADKKKLIQLLAQAHSGMSTEEFSQSAKTWLNSARHPKTNKLYKEMIYQPMLELLDYLRANDYKVFIVSGGGIDFLRVFSQEVYGIPPEQVVGTSVKAKYEVIDGVPTIVKLPELNFLDDKEGKPVGIHQHIGLRPIFAAGNSDGDYQMLEWTTAGSGARMGLLIHHTDAKREWAYDKGSMIGGLDRGLDDAKKKGWLLVDMKKDWKVIYP